MSRLLVVLAGLVLLAPASAGAQSVAREGKQTLRAVPRGADGVCVVLRGRFELGRECRPAPVSAWRPIRVSNDAAVGRDPYAVALPSAVHSARIGARRVPVVSSAGGRVKLVLQPGGGDGLARFFDRRGRLIGVDASVGYVSLAADIPVFGTREEPASATAYAQRVLDPAPGALDHVRPLACVNTVNGPGGNGACEEEVVLQPGCSAPDLVSAVLPTGLAALRLTFADGSRQVVPGTPLPEAFGGASTAITLIPVGSAVRRVEALDATGVPALAGRLDAPPAGQVCDDDDDPDGGPVGDEARLRPVGLPQTPVVARTGERTALLTDLPGRGLGAPRLCFGIDRLRGVDCRDAPVDAVPLKLRRTGDALATLLGPQAALVRAYLRDGRRVTALARPPAGYAGAWRGQVTVALLPIPRGSVIERLVVRDRRGRVVGRRVVDRPSKPEPVGGSG